jgi:hypothetical protein
MPMLWARRLTAWRARFLAPGEFATFLSVLVKKSA